jgi:hypothetical protein
MLLHLGFITSLQYKRQTKNNLTYYYSILKDKAKSYADNYWKTSQEIRHLNNIKHNISIYII